MSKSAALVIGIIGFIAVAGLFMAFWLIYTGKPSNDAQPILGICTTALGFVGGVLSRTEKAIQPDQVTTTATTTAVTNSPAEQP